MKNSIGLVLFLFVINLSFAQTSEEFYAQADKAYLEGDFKKAAKFLRSSIELEPTQEAYLYLGDCYAEMKDFEKKFIVLNEGLGKFPESSYLYNSRALFYQYSGHSEAAERDYGLAVKFAETDTVAFVAVNNRGTLFMQTRRFEQAYEDLIYCYEMDSTYIPALVNLGAVCDEVGRDDEVLYYYSKVIELDSTVYQAYMNIGFFLQKEGKYKESISYFNRVIRDNPGDPFTLNNRGYSKLMLGNLKGALEDVNASIKIAQMNSYAYRNRALIYIEMGKEKKACEDIQRSLDYGFTDQYGEEVIELQRKHCHN